MLNRDAQKRIFVNFNEFKNGKIRKFLRISKRQATNSQYMLSVSLQKRLNDPGAVWVVDSGGGLRNHVLRGAGIPRPGKEATLGAGPPLKCIRLWKQETPQQRGAADLSARTARHRQYKASEWTRPSRGWQVRGRCGLSSKFFDHLSHRAVTEAIQQTRIHDEVWYAISDRQVNWH